MKDILLQKELLNKCKGVDFIKKIINLIIIIMGLCVINIASFFYIDKEFKNNEELEVIAKIISIKEEKEYRNKYIVKILKCNENSSIKNIKLIIYTSKNDVFLPGDIVKIEGSFSKPETQRNFGGFDYSKYLKQFKIFGIVETEKIEYITKNITIFDNFQILRKKLLDKLDRLFIKEKSGFLKSLLFGKTDEISENIKNDFRESNISHILAISGQHFNYVIISLNTISSKIIKNKKLKNNILICCLIIFLNLTGNPVSGIRACIMSIMVYLASNFERKNNFYLSFIFSWLIIIVYNPYNFYNVGFWLSYFGTLGIVMFFGFFKKYSYHKLKKFKAFFYEKETLCETGFRKIIIKICKYIFDNFLLTISAQILIFPIIMYSFNTISFSFFISNILISFLIGPVLILSYITIILSYFKIPFLNIVILVVNFLIEIILNIAKICTKLPFSQIYVITPSFVYIILFYLIIIVYIYFFYNKKIYILKILCSKKFLKKEVKKIKSNLINILDKIKEHIKNNNKIFCKFCCFIVLISIVIFNNQITETILEINFIDVGQGDCTYIKTPNGKNIIIDGGEGNTEKYDYGKKIVLPYLLDKKVKKIDYLIISHADSDHIGGVFALIENLKVEKIIIGIQAEDSIQYEKLLQIAKIKKVPIYHVDSNNKIFIEKGIFIDVLWPIKGKIVEENSLNNNSLVFKFCYKNFSILFTGDIEKIAEEQIIKEYEKNNILNSQVLKVAHHGSKTSTINGFLEKVSPQIALIGVGKDNKFGHPSKDVLNSLEKNSTIIFRTDKNGEINIFVNKYGRIRMKTKY